MNVVDKTLARIQDLFNAPIPTATDEEVIRLDVGKLATHKSLRTMAGKLNQSFHAQNRKVIMRNLKNNSRYLGGGKSLNVYKGKMYNKPAIIVAMGPGYDQDLDRLRKLSHMYATFCIDRAYPVMEEAGITIAACMVVDRIAKPIKNKKSCPLIAAGITNKYFLQEWKGPKHMFGTITGEAIDADFAKAFPAPIYLGHSGNVSGALFTLIAGTMDAPIVTFHGHTFAALEEPKENDWIQLAPELWTRMDYYYYGRWLEAQINELYEQKCFVNTQPDGLLDVRRQLKNMIHRPLSDDELYYPMLENRWDKLFHIELPESA